MYWMLQNKLKIKTFSNVDHSSKHRATTLMIVALGNSNPHLVENVGQVEEAGQTRLRSEQGKCIFKHYL